MSTERATINPGDPGSLVDAMRRRGAITEPTICSFCGEECGHRFDEIAALRATLYDVICGRSDDPDDYGVVLNHALGTAHIGSNQPPGADQ